MLTIIQHALHAALAQPPLFKAKRGKTSRYLKDEQELEDYLFGLALDGAEVTCGDGEAREGER